MLIMDREGWQSRFKSEAGKAQLELLYGESEKAYERYLNVFDGFVKAFGYGKGAFFSAPGRTELSGNHTDHQHGCVLAGAITMDMLAVVYPRGDMKIRLVSEGYPLTELEINELSPIAGEKNTTAAIIRGVAAGLTEQGYGAGGFDAYMVSDVPRGSGLSSSAAIEILIGIIQNVLYNSGGVDAVTLAKIGRYAENNYFGKPSGLMDQTSIALGGVSFIDFGKDELEFERLDIDFRSMGWEICVVNAGGAHDNLTEEYSAITEDMRAVSSYFGKAVLADVCEYEFYKAIADIRAKVNDRAIIRAIHFFRENARVPKQLQALKNKDIESYRKLMLESGRSSYEYLQNIYPVNDEKERSVSLALCLSEIILGEEGAWRVHGGGFAGTIQALVPLDLLDSYISKMQAVFGEDSVYCLRIRSLGGYCFK